MEMLISLGVQCFLMTFAIGLFCFYVFHDRLKIQTRRLVLYSLLVASAAGAVNALLVFCVLRSSLPVSLGAIFTLLPLLVIGFFALRAVTAELTGIVLFVLYLAVQVQYICQSVTYFVYSLWFPSLMNSNTLIDILGFGLPVIILTPLFAVAGRRIYLKLRQVSSNEYTRLWVLPLLFILLYIIQVLFYPMDEYPAQGVKIVIGLCAFITYSQMASSVSSAAKAARESEQRDGLAHQLEMQQARVADLESYSDEMTRIRHDRRQHTQVLRGLLEQGKTSEALAYLEDYEDSMTANLLPLCKNFVADTLCRRYEALAKQSDISTDLSVDLPQEPGVAGSDLAVILGNLWENAVTAALDAAKERRFIRLQVQTEENKVLIRMENGFNGKVCEDGERFLSTKLGRGKAAGIGIASIKAVAAKYGGMADFTYTKDIFTASVLLYTKSDK